MIVVFNPTNRRAMFSYDSPPPEGIEDVLVEHGHSFTHTDSTVPLHRMYVEEDGTVVELNDFVVTLSKPVIENDGADTCTFSGLPQNTEVFVDGALVGTFTGTFDLAATEEGVYVVRLSHPRFMDATYEVTAQ